MNPVAKGVIIGVLGVIVVGIALIYIIPAIDEFSYYYQWSEDTKHIPNKAGDYYGNTCDMSQIEDVNIPGHGWTWKCNFDKPIKYPKEESKTEYEKDVWKIKNKHYANLKLFKDGKSSCEKLESEIYDIKNTRKTNWSPLDQKQWNLMYNDYLTTQRDSC